MTELDELPARYMPNSAQQRHDNNDEEGRKPTFQTGNVSYLSSSPERHEARDLRQHAHQDCVDADHHEGHHSVPGE